MLKIEGEHRPDDDGRRIGGGFGAKSWDGEGQRDIKAAHIEAEARSQGSGAEDWWKRLDTWVSLDTLKGQDLTRIGNRAKIDERKHLLIWFQAFHDQVI